MSKNRMPRLQIKSNNKRENINESVIDFKHLSKMLIIVLLIFGFTYVIIGLINGEINFDLFSREIKSTKVEPTINYEEILAGETFNKNHNEYYVIFYDFKSDDRANYEAYILDRKTPIYKVDTTNKMNSKYITDSNPNKAATKITELKVKDPTLLKITNKTISAYIETKNLIISELEKVN